MTCTRATRQKARGWRMRQRGVSRRVRLKDAKNIMVCCKLFVVTTGAGNEASSNIRRNATNYF